MRTKERQAEAKRTAKEYVDAIREQTYCVQCGGQPIDWHHDEHPDRPHQRVSSMRASGLNIERIQQEIDRCEPLCRSCHMKEDGRGVALQKSAPRQRGDVLVHPMPCSCCGREYKPLRKGMCSGCYNHHTGLRPRKRMTCCGCCNE